MLSTYLEAHAKLVTPKVCAPWEIVPFDAILFVMVALMAIAAMLLLILYLRSIGERGGRWANLR
jgi:hypothetical protein